ncbi:hypothetical protein QYE76_055211, partial [Lolium multiflorum]
KFEMSMMGELKFFLGFQVRQLAKGTFISQEKYVKDMLKKFNMTNASPMKTPMPVKGQLGSCDGEKDVDIKEPVEEEIDEPESSLDEKEEEIDELESSLDEKEEESDEQKEEEWISYPCQPSNESNSLSLTLFDCPPCLPKEVECYVPVDSLEIVPMSNTCENDYATVIYDNPCYFDKSYDNALFVPDVEMHERLFGQYSRIRRNEDQTSYFSRKAPNTEGETERRPGPDTTRPRGQALAAPAYEEGALVPLRRLFAYLSPFDLKTPYLLTKL